jgi:hypothetical protein
MIFIEKFYKIDILFYKKTKCIYNNTTKYKMNEFRIRENERHYDNYDRRYYDKGNYDSDSHYNDSWYDEVDEVDEVDKIIYSEYDNDNECIHKKYYIGSYWYENHENHENHENIIHAKTVKISTFYHFTNDCISNYICLSCDLQFTPSIEIIQVIMNDDGTYKYIIKTFWIKIIQRKWKKRMQDKKNIE